MLPRHVFSGSDEERHEFRNIQLDTSNRAEERGNAGHPWRGRGTDTVCLEASHPSKSLRPPILHASEHNLPSTPDVFSH